MILVNDCDHYFRFGKSDEPLTKLFLEELDGVLWTFRSDSPNYSFVEADEHGFALRTAEKRVISDRAIAGIYCFESIKTAKKIYSEYKQNLNSGEFYISQLFDLLIRNGGKVAVGELEEHIAFGTPAELNNAQHLFQSKTEPKN